jgi:hypothetical protein
MTQDKAAPHAVPEALPVAWEKERASLQLQIKNLERIKQDLNNRLFGALKTDRTLALGLHEVDHAIDLNRGTYSAVLDVACVHVARVKELEAHLAAPVAAPAPCVTEQDCTQEPWCRIKGSCQKVAAPAAEAQTQEPMSDLSAFKTTLLAYADEEYCRALRMYRTDPCLGWEAKVKSGKYGAVEYNAHKEANEHMGAHRGIYAAVKLAASSASSPMVMLTEEEAMAAYAIPYDGEPPPFIERLNAVISAFAAKNGAAVAPKEN